MGGDISKAPKTSKIERFAIIIIFLRVLDALLVFDIGNIMILIIIIFS